jgi:hypothetical protein
MTTELLQKFCANDSTRPELSKPFTQGGYTYATNNVVVLRVPAIPDVPENPSAPKEMEKRTFQEWPIDTSKSHIVASLTIPELKGPLSCKTCGGSGTHYCECGCEDPHTCGDCDGQKEFSEMPVAVDLGKHRVSHLVLNALKSLPNCVIQESSIDGKSALGIIFDGGDGRFMPMRRDDV